ncbi:amidohydrolase family protein [Pedobacter xixiisoli]|uniref:Cytosine/adenosine deaminase n=1 Tax=Pedobacter xixiisoli TaxID=1476464 RepID=A0A286AEP2_9SPHI|nr:amidohydrolase family protein [Pedobacter xixiisoli]SOD20372.1 Cytosine/adenosine deaminase [Pedobacter xixiisoli]
MQRYLSAELIYPVTSAPIANGVLEVSITGEIISILTAEEAEQRNLEGIEQFEGVLVPGFVNTHCHLELSHMFGKIPEHTGLPAFVREIVAQRAAADEIILAAMDVADKQMLENGIVAVGDISNQLLSKEVKQHSSLYYHTFVEVFGFNRPSQPIIDEAVKIRDSYWPLKASIVPHAPYSVSDELFQYIEKNTRPHDILSIHNQETAAENEFFERGTGDFEAMYQRMGVPKSEAHGTGKNAIHYHLPQMPSNKTLLVHNTFTSKADIDFASGQHKDLYWCLCPNANVYIENNLPDVNLFFDSRVIVTLGTDSLASNHQLSILAEMQTLQQKKRVPFDELLKWATINGAAFLGIDSQYGSFEAGKTPGVNLIELGEAKIIKSKNVKRLI